MNENQDQRKTEELDLAILEQSLLEDEDLEHILEQKDIEIKKLKQINQKIKRKLDSLTTEQTKIDEYKTQNQEFKFKIQDLNDKLEESNQKVEETLDLQKEINLLKKRNDELEGKLRTISTPKLSLNEKLESYQKELEKKHLRITKLERKLLTSTKNLQNKELLELQKGFELL